MSADVKYERATPLLEAELGDELVALDAEGGRCFGFNPIATEAWRELATPRSVPELAATFSQRYAVSSEECAADLTELVEQLCALGLVRRTD